MPVTDEHARAGAKAPELHLSSGYNPFNAQHGSYTPRDSYAPQQRVTPHWQELYDPLDLLVAEGLNATAKNVTASDNKPQITADKFQRIIQQMQEADILFLIQQANLRRCELR